MRAFISKIIVSLILAMSISSTCNAWVIDRDFNAGTVGMSAQGQPDGFDGAATDSVYDNINSMDGQAVKLQVKAGETGFGEWGGIINFPAKLAKGKKVYFEMYIYIPSSFQVQSGNGSLKFLRFYAERSDGSNGGALDIQLRDDGNTDVDFRVLKENQAIWYYFGPRGTLKRDQWHRVNVELGIDNVPVASGGGSYMKFWLDRSLITTENEIQVITQPTDVVKNFLLFTYYNSGSPKDQHVRADNIKISDVRPPEWDVLETKVIAPPKPPTVLP